MRALASAVLAFESIVLALAIPVAITIYNVDAAKAGWVGGLLAISCLLVVGCLRFSWAIPAGWFIQGAALAAGFVVPPMFFLGAMFALLWWWALKLGRLQADAQVPDQD
ncbi:MAG: DUF4233 domain-containing protein [Actinomycetes bacterium]